MKLKELPQEYEKAIPVLKKLENAGFEAYFVGGSVRDTLLKQNIHDVDIATSAFPEEIKQLFPKSNTKSPPFVRNRRIRTIEDLIVLNLSVHWKKISSDGILPSMHLL